MSSEDDTPRFHRLRSAASATTDLASAWTSAKTAKLKYRAHTLQTQLDPPDSWAEASGHATEGDRFQDRQAQRAELEQYHNIRVDGGIVATLLEARGLMVFGVGGEFVAERDAVATWLNDQFDQLDLLTLDIGTDALFYGYSLGEIRETVGGDFGKVEFIEPWTTAPKVSNKGEILSWEQEIKNRSGPKHTQEFDPDDVLHFNVMKASGRDPVGMSMLGRAMDEATSYRDNQEAIQNAVTLHGFPKWHIKLGREDGAVIDDNELRRARPMFDNINELTKWVTGQDVDISTISPEGFEFENITEHDLSKLAIAFMLPVELTQIGGGDGLGTGFPAKLRERLFLLSAYAQQNQLAGQLVHQLAKPLIENYAPEEIRALVPDIDEFELAYAFDEPITDMEELDTKINAVGDDMTVNERRNLFDLPPLDDDEIGEDFDSPGEAGGSDDGAGFFSEPHTLQDDEFWWEDYLDAMQKQVVWADETDHTLFGFSEGETPAFVKAQLFEAVLEGSPIFSDIKSIPDSELMDFRVFMADQLTDDGWTISQMQDEIIDRFEVEPDRAETVARSTTQNMVAEAAEDGYRDREDFEDLRFKWPEINDGRDSDVCLSINDRVPDEGLPLDELKDVVQEEAREHDLDPRGWTPHPRCRRRPIRVVS